MATCKLGMTQKRMFKDLLDGQVFRFNSKRWIKVAESCDYNAVSFHNSRLSCDFGLDTIVEIEEPLSQDEWDKLDAEYL